MNGGGRGSCSGFGTFGQLVLVLTLRRLLLLLLRERLLLQLRLLLQMLLSRIDDVNDKIVIQIFLLCLLYFVDATGRSDGGTGGRTGGRKALLRGRKLERIQIQIIWIGL